MSHIQTTGFHYKSLHSQNMYYKKMSDSELQLLFLLEHFKTWFVSLFFQAFYAGFY